MSNSKLNKVNTEIKNGSKVILNLSSNVIGNDNDKTNFLNKLWLTIMYVLRIRKACANNHQIIKIMEK